MTPIVRVIAHTTFLGVPPDLLPIEKAKNQQEERLAEALCAHDTKVADLAAKKIVSYPVPPVEAAYTSDRVIETEARRMVNAAGQDRGTDAERLIECAGKCCYDSYGVGRSSDAYHKHILEVGHGSVEEHSWITFFLSNISRANTHELVRHRVGIAISQRSSRFCDESFSAWVHHPLMQAYCREQSIDIESFTGDEIGSCRVLYDGLVERLQAWLTAKGTDKLTARKQARGAARGYLGNALLTEMVWSCNVRSLRTILDQRAKAAADAEIRVLFNRIYEEALPYFPAYLQYEKRSCPDGIGYELFDPKAPAERLKKVEAENQALRERMSSISAAAKDT